MFVCVVFFLFFPYDLHLLFSYTLVSVMISYELAGNQTTSIPSVIVALTLLRRLGYFSVVFDKITVRALSCISFGCAGKSENRFDEECLRLM